MLARAGVASRRDAERMIEEGRVAVNGKVIDSPALNVTAKDRVTVDDAPLAEPEAARLWMYYKPIGLVTTNSDEKGRETIFDKLPEDLPRVLSVGRLDLNSEGLLLLTNDGGIKRKLELPSTGWLRKYRVRVNGTPTEAMLEPLRAGIVVDGQAFQPMQVTLDRQQGANAWLTVGLREGKNREIRRAMSDVGLTVNRLIRVSYGPFQLGQMNPGEVIEVRPKVMRDQLGLEGPPPASRAAAANPALVRADPACRAIRRPANPWRARARPRPQAAATPRPADLRDALAQVPARASPWRAAMRRLASQQAAPAPVPPRPLAAAILKPASRWRALVQARAQASPWGAAMRRPARAPVRARPLPPDPLRARHPAPAASPLAGPVAHRRADRGASRVVRGASPARNRGAAKALSQPCPILDMFNVTLC